MKKLDYRDMHNIKEVDTEKKALENMAWLDTMIRESKAAEEAASLLHLIELAKKTKSYV